MDADIAPKEPSILSSTAAAMVASTATSTASGGDGASSSSLERAEAEEEKAEKPSRLLAFKRAATIVKIDAAQRRKSEKDVLLEFSGLPGTCSSSLPAASTTSTSAGTGTGTGASSNTTTKSSNINSRSSDGSGGGSGNGAINFKICTLGPLGTYIERPMLDAVLGACTELCVPTEPSSLIVCFSIGSMVLFLFRSFSFDAAPTLVFTLSLPLSLAPSPSLSLSLDLYLSLSLSLFQSLSEQISIQKKGGVDQVRCLDNP